jgi:hypothetical protein
MKDHADIGASEAAAELARRRIERWRRLLREDRKQGMTEPEIPIESLYDEATGLPK